MKLCQFHYQNFPKTHCLHIGKRDKGNQGNIFSFICYRSYQRMGNKLNIIYNSFHTIILLMEKRLYFKTEGNILIMGKDDLENVLLIFICTDKFLML